MHVVLRIQPHRYIHKHHCEQAIVVHRHPTIRAMLSRSQLRLILKEIRDQHGEDVSIRRRWWRLDEADIVLAYSQHRLTDSSLVQTFEQWVENMVRRAHALHLTTA
jgi:hypothetical protein